MKLSAVPYGIMILWSPVFVPGPQVPVLVPVPVPVPVWCHSVRAGHNSSLALGARILRVSVTQLEAVLHNSRSRVEM